MSEDEKYRSGFDYGQENSTGICDATGECPEQSLIPVRYLEQLQALGLWFHVAPHCFNHGVRIYKPTVAGGNRIAEFEPTQLVNLHEENGNLVTQVLSPQSDAATVYLFQDPLEGKWIVSAADGVGGMVPGDFVDVWDSGEEAIADIEDFYFGDPARMRAKEAYRRDPVGEIERATKEGRMPI